MKNEECLTRGQIEASITKMERLRNAPAFLVDLITLKPEEICRRARFYYDHAPQAAREIAETRIQKAAQNAHTALFEYYYAESEKAPSIVAFLPAEQALHHAEAAGLNLTKETRTALEKAADSRGPLRRKLISTLRKIEAQKLQA